ncbi:MAG: hypothetical protein AMS21_01030 [Gemmatimonas sp. SG8_38_2]|nr:MAG: hypothetical protein AMS21_01030 [Gemmatimonas sp. SG8_38_2]
MYDPLFSGIMNEKLSAKEIEQLKARIRNEMVKHFLDCMVVFMLADFADSGELKKAKTMAWINAWRTLAKDQSKKIEESEVKLANQLGVDLPGVYDEAIDWLHGKYTGLINSKKKDASTLYWIPGGRYEPPEEPPKDQG